MDVGINKKLQEMIHEYGFVLPDRGDLDAPNIQWKEGKPDYGKADLKFFEGKSKNHKPGSLEMVVENLVKQWEMEITHLSDCKDWTTVEPDVFCVQVNGGREISGQEAAKVGSYNWIMEDAPKELYDAQAETFESSHSAFRGAFADGFSWEVLEVYSGPPRVAFSWRHWGDFTGSYKGRKGDGERIELYGFSIATLSSNKKITKVEAFLKFDSFLKVLQGMEEPEELGVKHSACPIIKQKGGQ